MIIVLTVSFSYRLTTEAHHSTHIFKEKNTFLLLSCKSWLCLPWCKALVCLCLHSCQKKDFCLCAFRPLYNLLKHKEAGHDGLRPERCLHFLDCFQLFDSPNKSYIFITPCLAHIFLAYVLRWCV